MLTMDRPWASSAFARVTSTTTWKGSISARRLASWGVTGGLMGDRGALRRGMLFREPRRSLPPVQGGVSK
jgi:hypothetical protein